MKYIAALSMAVGVSTAQMMNVMAAAPAAAGQMTHTVSNPLQLILNAI
jgi:hypothetical protein